MPCTGGVSGVCHSRLVACHGLPPAGLPWDRLQNRLNRNSSCDTPTISAAMVMKAFSSWADCGMNS
ncbi:hypothetical protein D3C81_2150100 [compost metagenome]